MLRVQQYSLTAKISSDQAATSRAESEASAAKCAVPPTAIGGSKNESHANVSKLTAEQTCLELLQDTHFTSVEGSFLYENDADPKVHYSNCI